MKKTTFVIYALLISIFGFGQDVGSGTIIFNTSANFPIEFTATDLFDGGINVYNVTGNTNESIAFGPWAIPATLGSEEVLFTNNVLLPKNPNSALNLLIKANEASQVDVKVYDLNGRLVSSPAVIKNDNGLLQYYDALPSVRDGLYLVKVNTLTFSDSFKFIKYGEASSPVALNVKYNKSSKSTKTSKTQAPNNYVISWNNTGYGYYGGTKGVEILQGSSNTISIDPTPVIGTENGDFAIEPLFNGTPKYNNKITATNTIVPDSTYTRIISNVIVNNFALGVFGDAFVSNANNPSSYKIDIVSNDVDPDFLPTTAYVDIYQDVNGEINGSKQVNLTPIPNQQDITMVVRDFETLNLLDGVTIEMYSDDGDSNYNNDTLLDTQVSDANGEVFFANVSGSTNLYFKNSKTGYYTKTNNGYATPLVDRISEMDTLLNVLAVPKFNYWDATTVTAAMINLYKPIAWQTEFVLGHWRVYFPPAAQRQTMVDHFAEVATYLGFPNAMIPYDTPFPDPRTNGTLDSYQPYIENREVNEGLMGCNITNYNGTGTGILTKDLPNGVKVAASTSTVNLGGLDWSDTDHEIGNMLAFPLISSTSMFSTSRDLNAAANIPIADSMSDTALMPFWLRYSQLHFDMVDSQGRLIEFMPVPYNSFED